MRNIGEYIASRSVWSLLGMGLLVLLAIGIADYQTGHELSIFILYLAPVMVVSAFGSIWAGLAMSVVAAAVWLSADMFVRNSTSQSYIPYWNTAVRLLLLATVAVLQNTLSKEKHIARTDHLTGMPNRKHYYEAVEKELLLARRYPHPFSAAYIDIDNFKGVNDRHGHAAGDQLLKSVGSVIRKHIRSVDVGARVGGDEFGILLPHTSAESARGVLTKLQKLLNGAMARQKWPVTFSFGVVTFQQPPESVDDIMRRADAVMYEAKKHGKDRVHFALYGEADRKNEIAESHQRTAGS